MSACRSTGTCAGPRSIAVTLILEIREVLRESQGLDRGWGLGVAGRAVMGRHIRIHARCAWDGHTVLVVSGIYQELAYSGSRGVVHRRGHAHGSRSVSSTSREGSSESGRNLGGEDRGGWGKDELFVDNSKQGLDEACLCQLVGALVFIRGNHIPRTLLPHPTIMSESHSSLRFVASGTARMVW